MNEKEYSPIFLLITSNVCSNNFYLCTSAFCTFYLLFIYCFCDLSILFFFKFYSSLWKKKIIFSRNYFTVLQWFLLMLSIGKKKNTSFQFLIWFPIETLLIIIICPIVNCSAILSKLSSFLIFLPNITHLLLLFLFFFLLFQNFFILFFLCNSYSFLFFKLWYSVKV